jgi:hypothetical protein
MSPRLSSVLLINVKSSPNWSATVMIPTRRSDYLTSLNKSIGYKSLIATDWKKNWSKVRANASLHASDRVSANLAWQDDDSLLPLNSDGTSCVSSNDGRSVISEGA